MDDGHPLCGSATVTWDYAAVSVHALFPEVSRLPSCEDGVPTAGEVVACSDVFGTSCSGEHATYDSTFDGFELVDHDFPNVSFGGFVGDLVSFELEGLHGIADLVSGRGYGVFGGASTGTLFCFEGIDWQSGDPASLRLTSFKRLGTCTEGQSVPSGTLEVCVGE